MDTIIWARPERTETEITADAHEAAKFFANIRNAPHFERNLARLREYLNYDQKLRLADFEGSEWAARNNPTNAQRIARREEVEAASQPRTTELRDFGTAETRADLPAAALHQTPDATRKESIRKTNTWFRGLTDWASGRILVAAREAGRPFEHWLLEHPHYGRADTTAPGEPMTRTRPAYAYERGGIRPAGMTPERALEIALEVLDRRGGEWR